MMGIAFRSCSCTHYLYRVCVFTLHAWVAILSLETHDNRVTRILQAHPHVHLFSLANISLDRAITTSASCCPAAFHSPSRPAWAPAWPMQGAAHSSSVSSLSTFSKNIKILLPASGEVGCLVEAQPWCPSKYFSWSHLQAMLLPMLLSSMHHCSLLRIFSSFPLWLFQAQHGFQRAMSFFLF